MTTKEAANILERYLSVVNDIPDGSSIPSPKEIREAIGNAIICLKGIHQMKDRVKDLKIKVHELELDVAVVSQDKIKYYKALKQIAGADYRGNRSPESYIAWEALNE